MARELVQRWRWLILPLLIALISIFAFSSGALRSIATDGALGLSEETLAKRIIVSQKCGSCHTLQARGLELQGTVGPDLTRQAQRNRSPHWLRRQLLEPKSIPDDEVLPGYEGKQKLMPPLTSLSEREIEALVDFLQTLG